MPSCTTAPSRPQPPIAAGNDQVPVGLASAGSLFASVYGRFEYTGIAFWGIVVGSGLVVFITGNTSTPVLSAPVLPELRKAFSSVPQGRAEGTPKSEAAHSGAA